MHALASKRFSRIRRLASALFAGAVLATSTADAAARFSGGLCASQGTWLQTALQQSEQVTSAINALRNDESCKNLIAAVDRSPRIDASTRDQNQNPDMTSYANFHRELSALSDYLKPANAGTGMDDKEFRNQVYQVVFNKSYDSIKNISADPQFSSLTDLQKAVVGDVGLRLRAFLAKSTEVANLTMATAQNVVTALPESKLCLHNHPSEALAIFSSIVHASASLVSGGKINGVGEFLGSLMNYSRDMDYVRNLQPMELQRFNASVSCLVESTSEAYCSMQDAEDALDFMKGVDADTEKKKLIKKILANDEADPVANPLGGLIILMRDIPILQGWMQRVLFGIDPRLTAEANMKNEYWTSFLVFIQSLNSLQAEFRDKEQLYLDTPNGARESKLSKLKDIHSAVIAIIVGGQMGNGAKMNFYTNVMNADQMRFFLLGEDKIPETFDEVNNFDKFWNDWTRDGTHGFNDPDRVLQTIRQRLWTLMDRAKVEANSFFASRMVVDPQNLVTESMKGPGISPYQAFVHLRTYYVNLAKKMSQSAEALKGDPEQGVRRRQLLAQIPLLRDSTRRLDKIIAALDSIISIPEDADEQKMTVLNRDAMNVIYETANMLVSRDSFFGTRMQTALQADLSDTLYNNRNLNDRQAQLLRSLGPDIVNRLSNYFGSDPVLQRTDISQAKVVQVTNLKSVESLFSRVVFQQVLSLHCQLSGGVSCSYVNRNIDPVRNSYDIKIMNGSMTAGKSGSFYFRWIEGFHKITEDSNAHQQLLAKLCVQSLAFETRDAFSGLCKGAVLRSDFATSEDREDLNLSYDQALARIHETQASNMALHIDKARGLGVCALRSYIRKNHVFYMYRDYLGQQSP